MAMKITLAAVGTGALVTLQGCGGGGSTTSAPGPSPPSSTPSPSPGPATTTNFLTTTLQAQPSTPLSGTDAATLMNQEYHGFDANSPTGSIGTYIRITGSTHVYCHEGCYSGRSDCRVSGSVYNPTQIVDSDTGAIKWNFVGTRSDGDYLGFWVNQTLIKERLGKCAYTVDGGTDNKYNMGCGTLAACTTYDCGDDHCAFASLDPDTNYQTYINEKSAAVASVAAPGCADPGTCAFKGPSFYKEAGYVQDDTFGAWKWRADNPGSMGLWNELVIDGEEMLRSLAYDPAGTIPAVLYASSFPGGAEAGRTKALAMAQEMATQWSMPTPVPVIKIDLSVDVRNGGNPFVFDSASEVEVV